MPHTMTPDQIKQARHKLGLSTSKMGRMLDIKDGRTYRAYEAPETASMHRPPPARLVRLMQAYLDGYRPHDWPVDT